MAKAGVIPQNEVEGLDKPIDSIEEFKASWKKKTAQERLSLTKGFFYRIREAIEILEDGGSLDDVLRWSEKHLVGGEAGKEFCTQLKSIKNGNSMITDLRGRWPAAFSK